MATRRRRKVRLNPRFFVFVGGIFLLIVILLLIKKVSKDTGTISFGEVNANIAVSGAIIRDEKIETTDKYQKVFFNAVEGEVIDDGTLVATVFKMGYQDESMIALLNLQKEVYAYQVKLLGGVDPTLNSLNEQILATEEIIRDISRGSSDKDELKMEQSLKELLTQRTAYLRSVVPADSELQSLYIQMDDQERSMNNWTRDYINAGGKGIVSFYFDGYENVLSGTSNKLQTINVSLISSVVSGFNTAKTTDNATGVPLYRLVDQNHWYMAYVSKIDDPMRVVEGEQYYVRFTDYSDAQYVGTARAPIVFTYETDEETSAGMGVVNILEFNSDIGKFYSIRTVKAEIAKSAQGLVVDSKLVSFVNGNPCVFVKNGDNLMQIDVDVMAADEKRAVIREKGGTSYLGQGTRVTEP